MRSRPMIRFFLLACLIPNACDKRDGGAAKPSSDATTPPAQSPTSAASPTNTPPRFQPVSPNPKWVADQTVHEFGNVWAGDLITHSFRISNQGGQTLQILSTKPGCGCSMAEGYPHEIAPGDSGAITFRLNTGGKHGVTDENIVIKTNDPEQPDLTIRMRGFVKVVFETEVVADSVADHAANPKEALAKIRGSAAAFGIVKADQRVQRTIKLKNTSGRTLAVKFHGIRPENSRFNASFQEAVPGEEFLLTITGDPPWQIGQNLATAVIETDIPGRSTFNIGLYAYLPGRIDVQPDMIVADPMYPYVKERPITITNYGPSPLEVTKVLVSDTRFKVEFQRAGEKARIVKVMLPDPPYKPPPYGELVRIETTDAEKKIIDVPVLPSLDRPATVRPVDKPLQLQTAWTAGN